MDVFGSFAWEGRCRICLVVLEPSLWHPEYSLMLWRGWNPQQPLAVLTYTWSGFDPEIKNDWSKATLWTDIRWWNLPSLEFSQFSPRTSLKHTKTGFLRDLKTSHISSCSGHSSLGFPPLPTPPQKKKSFTLKLFTGPLNASWFHRECHALAALACWLKQASKRHRPVLRPTVGLP